MSVRDTDKGYRDFMKRMNGLGAPKLQVGILAADAEKPYDDGVTVLQVAIWNEFGTATIPERSFLRAWFDENRERCKVAFVRMMRAVVAKKYTKEQALALLAQKFVGEIQKRIANGIPPANAASTIKEKGSSKPLIDTGQLRSSISYRVKP